MRKKKIVMMSTFIVCVLAILISVILVEVINYKQLIKKNNNDSSINLEESNQISYNNNSNAELNYNSENDSNTENGSIIEDYLTIESEINIDNEKNNTIVNHTETENNGNNINIDNKTNEYQTTTNQTKTNEINMVFAGDIYFSTYIEEKYKKTGIDGILSKELQQEFDSADIAMANQEFPFSNRGIPMEDKQFTFRVQPKYVNVLQEMGIDIVSLANNHVLDYGKDALIDTLVSLDEEDIKHVGAGINSIDAKKASQFLVKNRSVAILGASRVIPVANWNATSTNPGLLTTYDPTVLTEEIKFAKQMNDLVIVYVHWGIERNTKPEQYQRDLAKAYIDAGADVIIGSHPHVLQGIEFYKNKPIVYSLGNFMFYNTIDQTAFLKVTIDEKNQIQLSLIPCYSSDALTRSLENEDSKKKFYSYIEGLSFEVSIDSFGNVMNKKSE